MSCISTDGSIILSDGTELKTVITIIDARESGFSVFGGINIFAKSTSGAAIRKIAPKIADKVKDKPIYPIGEQPKDGWETVEINSYIPAHSEIRIETTKGTFLVSVKSIPNMVARNLNYRNQLNEPPYIVASIPFISWKHAVKGE